MHTLKSIVAIGLAALLLSTGLANAMSTRPSISAPLTTPTGPIVNNNGDDMGHHFDPAEYFTQDVIDHKPIVMKPGPAKNDLACLLSEFGQEGQFFGLAFRNNGDTVIPKGSKIVVTMPDGTPMVFEVPYDLEPGFAFMTQPLFDGAFPENWSCNMAIISA